MCKPVRNLMIDSIDELDQLRDVVRGADLEFTQLSAGRLQGMLMRFDLGGLCYDFHSASLSMRAKGGGSRKLLSFVLPEVPGVYNGYRLEPGQPIVFPPETSFEGQSLGGFRNHILTILPEQLAAAAARRGSRTDIGSLDVAGQLLCAPTTSRRLFRLCQTLKDGLLRGEIGIGATAARRRLQEALLSELCRILVCPQPNEPGRGAASFREHCRVVSAVEEFLATSNMEAPSIGDVCAVTGFPPRTLCYAFQQVLGLSPALYLRIRRLLAVRRALRVATPDHADVTTIAMEHGFWHLGRFAQFYKEFFGESPSVTLRREAAS
jgi:AraC-like DNA-binding protein